MWRLSHYRLLRSRQIEKPVGLGRSCRRQDLAYLSIRRLGSRDQRRFRQSQVLLGNDTQVPLAFGQPHNLEGPRPRTAKEEVCHAIVEDLQKLTEVKRAPLFRDQSPLVPLPEGALEHSKHSYVQRLQKPRHLRRDHEWPETLTQAIAEELRV